MRGAPRIARRPKCGVRQVVYTSECAGGAAAAETRVARPAVGRQLRGTDDCRARFFRRPRAAGRGTGGGRAAERGRRRWKVVVYGETWDTAVSAGGADENWTTNVREVRKYSKLLYATRPRVGSYSTPQFVVLWGCHGTCSRRSTQTNGCAFSRVSGKETRRRATDGGAERGCAARVSQRTERRR